MKSINKNSSNARDEVVGYKSLHWAAVAAIAIALISPICLFVQWFAVIPVLGIIIGFMGYLAANNLPEIYRGRNLSLVGILVSLLLLVSGITGSIKSKEYYFDTAYDNTVHWLTYLKNDDLPAAHQVMIDVESRENDVQFLNNHYANNKGLYDDMLTTFAESPIRLLLDTRDKWEPEDLRLIDNEIMASLKKNKMRIGQLYHLPLNDSADEIIAFRILYYRVYDSVGRASQWQLEDVADVK